MKFSALTRSTSKGFTLVELLIVIAIIGILSTISFLSLISFQKRQKLLNAAREVSSAFNLAKSRAQSQVKPVECNDTMKLNGYRLRLTPQTSGTCSSGSCFWVIPVCNNIDMNNQAVKKNMPSGIFYFGRSDYLFNVLSGHVNYNSQNPSTDLVLTNNTDSFTITIFKDGRIFLNE